MMLLVKLVKFSSGALQLEHAPPTQLLPVVRLFSADIFGGRKIETREVVGLIRWKKREGRKRSKRERRVDGRASFNTVAASSSFGNEFCSASV